MENENDKRAQHDPESPGESDEATDIRQRIYFLADRESIGNRGITGNAGRTREKARIWKCNDVNDGGAGYSMADEQSNGHTRLKGSRHRRTGTAHDSEHGRCAGNADELEASAEFGLRGRRDGDSERGGGQIQTEGRGSSSPVVLGDGIGEGLEGRQGDEECPGQLALGQAGFTNGFWRDPVWIRCLDTDKRGNPRYRPIARFKSLPSEMDAVTAANLGLVLYEGQEVIWPTVEKTVNRNMRIRGYGESINAELATEFIKATQL